VGIDTARYWARYIYSGHCHPFFSIGQGVARVANVCGAGVIVLFVQGDPPHSKPTRATHYMCKECGSTDRSEDRLTVSRFSSQTSNPKQD
jgi:hypothetical protein